MSFPLCAGDAILEAAQSWVSEDTSLELPVDAVSLVLSFVFQNFNHRTCKQREPATLGISQLQALFSSTQTIIRPYLAWSL